MIDIGKERWEQAQEAEKQYHRTDMVQSEVDHYHGGKNIIFRYLNLKNSDLEGKNIIEVGGGNYPALCYCQGMFKMGRSVEPREIPEEFKKWHENEGIKHINKKAEEYRFPKSTDEVWLFNVLQHVQDPEKIIRNVQKIGATLRVFEPINTKRDKAHPHSFTQEWFETIIGQTGNVYNDRLKGFHQAQCFYGTFDFSG